MDRYGAGRLPAEQTKSSLDQSFYDYIILAKLLAARGVNPWGGASHRLEAPDQGTAGRARMGLAWIGRELDGVR